MRMKLNKSSQLVLVSAASLVVATLIAGCALVRQATQTLTVDFVYVASSKAAGPNDYGEIDVFEINSESGFMRQIPSSPFPSEGRNPIAETASADYSSLFVVNQDDNSVVQFVIGIDGKLYPYNTVNTPGVFPSALAANANELFVVDTYQPLPSASVVHPCSGSLAVYPLTAATKNTAINMGPPAVNDAIHAAYWPMELPGTNSDPTGCTSSGHVIVPTGVTVLANGSEVFVSAYDSSATPTPVGYIFGFSVGTGGVLTPLSGSPWMAGSELSAIASDPSSNYVYATDYAKNTVLGFSVASGAFTPLSGSPYPAGNQPSAIVVNPSFPYLYVTNSLDATVEAYTMSSGVLSRLGTYTTGADPVGLGIDPSTNHFLYTVNFLGNNVNDFQMSTTAGTLINTQNSPYPSDIQPTAIAAIPHNGTGAGVTK